jgi:hypothetical protein
VLNGHSLSYFWLIGRLEKVVGFEANRGRWLRCMNGQGTVRFCRDKLHVEVIYPALAAEKTGTDFRGMVIMIDSDVLPCVWIEYRRASYTYTSQLCVHTDAIHATQ